MLEGLKILGEINSELGLQLEVILRCILAALCGAIIGIERKNRLKDAGLRTHLIVALGSALMMVVSKYGFFDVLRYANELGVEIRLDPSRLASNIITGIGFLGAGTIFIRKQVINGLTTAAGLWATAGIGMAIGAGMYIVGLSITLFQFLVQIILHRNLKVLKSHTSDCILLKVEDAPDILKRISELMNEKKISIHYVKYEKLDNGLLEVECIVKFPKKYTALEAASDLKEHAFIKSLEI